MVYVSLRQIPQWVRQLSRAAFPVVNQKCKLLWSCGFWVAATRNRRLEHLALAPECFNRSGTDNLPSHVIGRYHSRGPAQAWGSSWLWTEPWVVFLILGWWQHLNPLNRHGKERKRALTPFVHTSSHLFFPTPPTIILIFHIRTLSTRELSMSAEIYSTGNLLNESFSPSVWYQSPSPL